MKKGFTLIELLSVIAVLSIIAIITIPVVSNIIQSGKDRAYNTQVSIIVDGAKKWIDKNYDSISENHDAYITVNKLITSGTIEQDKLINPKTNEQMTGCVKVSYAELYQQYDYEYKEDCSSYLVKYDNGTSINFNPETGTLCDDPVSKTSTKTGCMKWYIFNDSEDDMTVNLLLDHNTTPLIIWVTSTDYIASGGTAEDYGTSGNTSLGPITVTNKLKSDTATWKKEFNPRLISANEIAKIVNNTTWNSKTATTSLSFYPNSSDDKTKYAWLYENLKDATKNGAISNDNGSHNYSYYNLETQKQVNYSNYMYGYWTSDPCGNVNNSAWRVASFANVSRQAMGDQPGNGVRPVITIPKYLLNS